MGQAVARIRAEKINLQIINTLAARRARIGEAGGDRAPAGAARAPMELVEIRDKGALALVDGPKGAEVAPGEVIQITEYTKRTARRRLPKVLSRMDEGDPRRRAAELYAEAHEKLASVAGASAEGAKTDGGPATNDGGVTTRIKYAATIGTVEAALICAGVALTPRARGGSFGARRAISARSLIDAVCLEGVDMKTILRRAGWSGQRRDGAQLTQVAELCLELMARRLGLVASRAPLPGIEE